MLSKNFNKRPRKYSKIIEAVAIILTIIFCIWLLTACKKDNVPPKLWDGKNETVDNYNKLGYKTIIAIPKYDNKGFIWSFCKQYPVETSKLTYQEKIDVDSLVITLKDTLVDISWGKEVISIRGTVQAYFTPKKFETIPWKTTDLYIDKISSDGVITASCQPGDGYNLTIDGSNINVKMNVSGNYSFSYKIINKY